MKLLLKRIISSGSFIPEIDGLRFIAIASVVLFHLDNFLSLKYPNYRTDIFIHSFSKNLLSKGFLGVFVFFVISGFILGLPFAKFYLVNGRPIDIKKFYIKRLTRLEPPYILVMTLLLIGAVFIVKGISLNEGVKSYLASITYLHNIIYPETLPKLTAVTWSLEIEIQFYILIPLIASIFSIKSKFKRRILILFILLFFLTINKFNLNPFHFKSILNYFHYFLAGLLLADIYVSASKLLPETKFDSIITSLFFAIIWIIDSRDLQSNLSLLIWELIQLCSIFIFFYYVLLHKTFKLLSFKLFTNIGGMCYSIYLLHLPVISFFGNYILRYTFSNSNLINILTYSTVLLFFVILTSLIFFLLVERPCMDESWYKKIFKKRN